MAKRRRRRRYDPLGPLTEDELSAQANRLVNASLVRPKQQIRRDQAEARRQAEADARMIQGFTQALAGIVGQAGPAVDKTYADATTRQAQIAQGLASQQQGLDQAAADQANQLIQAQGGTRRIDPGTGSQVTYMLGGKIPGDLLNQTGAAMSSIAHGYGAGVAGRGQQQVAGRLSKAQQEQAKLREQMDELMARVPGLRAEIMDKLYQREISKSATDTQRRYLLNAQNQTALEYQQTIDPVTGLPYSYLSDQAAAKDKQGEKKAAARKARMDALNSTKENVWQLAGELGSRTKHVPGFGDVAAPPPYQQAYQTMWSRYGQGLMRYAPQGHRQWWKRQINAMIVNALASNGIKKPPKRARKGQTPAGARGPVGV